MTETPHGLDRETCEDFLPTFRSALLTGAPWEELVELIREYKGRGLEQGVAYEQLMSLRSALEEALEDRLLDVLDVVSGWCSPHLRLWETTYER